MKCDICGDKFNGDYAMIFEDRVYCPDCALCFVRERVKETSVKTEPVNKLLYDFYKNKDRREK